MTDAPLGRKRRRSWPSSSSTDTPDGVTNAGNNEQTEAQKNAKRQQVNSSVNAGGGGNPVPPDMLSAHETTASSGPNDNPTNNNNGLTYSGTYGKMYLVPESFHHTMMNGSSNLIKNLHEDKIKQHVDAARSSANNPKAYQYHIIQANILKHATVANPNIDQRIQLSLTNPAIQQLNQKIDSYRRNPRLLKTDIGMKQYNAFQKERQIKLDVLQDEENKKYNNIISNPADNITALPASLQTPSHHTNTLKSFLNKHPNLIKEDENGNIFVENKLVAHGDENKNHLSRMIHYMMHDYESSSSVDEQTPEQYKEQVLRGLVPVLEALHRRGFSYENIGNRYLRKAMVAPRSSSTIPVHTTGTPYEHERNRLDAHRSRLQERFNQLKLMQESYKGNLQKRQTISKLMTDNIKQQNKLLQQGLDLKAGRPYHHPQPSTSGIATTPQRYSSTSYKNLLPKLMELAKSGSVKAILKKHINAMSGSATATPTSSLS